MSRNYRKTEEDTNNKKESRSRKSKGRRVKKQNEEVLNKGSRDNDPNWYFTSAELADQATQLSMQDVLGLGSFYGSVTPTIMRMDTVMCPGVTSNWIKTDGYPFRPENEVGYSHVEDRGGKAGVNLMAAKLYTTMSSFTGRTASYAPQDVAMMILGISSIAEVSETIRRVFGIALTYNYRNRTLPVKIIESMGIDAADFIDNLSIYRMRFNVAMSRINQIPLLENVAFINKSRDLYQHIYADDPTSMSQLFYYMPRYAFVIDEVMIETGTVLRADPLTGTNGEGPVSMATMLSKLEEQISAMLESSTLNFVYADILNMANKVGVKTWKFDYLAENYVVTPEYNTNALLQLHNLTIVGTPYWSDDGEPTHTTTDGLVWTNGANIYSDPDNNGVIYNPAFSTTVQAANLCVGIVDFPTDTPTVEDRVEALRYVSMASGVTFHRQETPEQGYTLTSCMALPDHFVSRISYFGNDIYNDLDKMTPLDTYGSSAWMKTAFYSANIGPLVKLTQFEHAPMLYILDSRSECLGVLGQLQFYAQYDYNYIQRLLQIMFVGLFDFRV